jgi:hypothetical protein
VLTQRQATVVEERSARRSPLAAEEVDQLLAQFDHVVLARSGVAQRRAASELTAEELAGPTGKFRAPMVRSGGTLLVGFHAATLEALLAR